mmetsp:Transcript_6253/g.9550  ORF Transcript_6253/g.9550 Transcript_6253/m.9550 type:complete len:457 (+) Transcript_6253:3-1373(+)
MDNLRDENKELKDKVARLKEALDSSVAKNTVLNVKMEQVEATLPYVENLEVEAELLRKKLKASSSEKEMIRVKCTMKKDENLRLRRALKKALACTQENEKLQKEMTHLRQDNLKLLDQLEAKENHLLSLSPKDGVLVFEPNRVVRELDSNQERMCDNEEEAERLVQSAVLAPGSKDTSGNTRESEQAAVHDTELSTTDETGSASSNYDAVRVHATKILGWAEKQLITTKGSDSVATSVASSMGTDFLPPAKGTRTEPTIIQQAIKGPEQPPKNIECPSPQIVISNIGQMGSQKDCYCQESSFSGNKEHIEFYLPKLGMGCSCGMCAQDNVVQEIEDPMSLENILRPWQVQFLKSQSLSTAVEYVHAFNQRGGILARAMRKWRKEQKMVSIKTRSCGIALHIWSRTCKAVARSVRKQIAEGVTHPVRPKFLEVSPDDLSMSTLGCGSMIEFGTEEEM